MSHGAKIALQSLSDDEVNNYFSLFVSNYKNKNKLTAGAYVKGSNSN